MRKNVPLSLIFLVVFVDLLGFGILIPILPSFAVNELHVKEAAVGIALAAYSLVQFLCNPVFGSLSDKYGRRRIILYTLLVNAVGYVLFAFSHTYWMLLLSRVVAGVGGSSIGVAQAYIADVTTREERSKGMGLIGVAFGLGFVFGPVLGGLLSHFGYFVVGIASAAFSLLALLLSIFFLPESKSEHTGEVRARKIIDPGAYRLVMQNQGTAIFIGMFFLITFSMANIYGTFALLGHNVYGFSDRQNGLMLGIVGLVSALVQGSIGRIHGKLTDLQIIIAGTACMMLGLLFIPYGQNFAGLAAATFILSIGTGALQPTFLSLISKAAAEKEQGLVLGVNQSFSAFGRMLGPLWGGFAFEFLGYPFPFLTGAFFSLLLLLFSYFWVSPRISRLLPAAKITE